MKKKKRKRKYTMNGIYVNRSDSEAVACAFMGVFVRWNATQGHAVGMISIGEKRREENDNNNVSKWEYCASQMCHSNTVCALWLWLAWLADWLTDCAEHNHFIPVATRP